MTTSGLSYDRKLIIADISKHVMNKIDRACSSALGLLDNDYETSTFVMLIMMQMLERMGTVLADDNARYAALNDEEKALVAAVLLRKFALFNAGDVDKGKLGDIVEELHAGMRAKVVTTGAKG